MADSSNDLLKSVLEAHGGLERWNKVQSITATFNISGWLLSVKGFPSHYQPTITIDPRSPEAILTGLTGQPNDKHIMTPNSLTISHSDGHQTTIPDPRSTFDGQLLKPWTDSQINYFIAYAFHNYLTTPFLFTSPGFTTHEITPYTERNQTWRVLEVTFPAWYPTHSQVQRFYFNDQFLLQRLDYVTDVAGGVVAHYVFDHTRVGGLSFPMLRRVVARNPTTDEPLWDKRTAFVIDVVGLKMRFEDGETAESRGAYYDVAEENRKRFEQTLG